MTCAQFIMRVILIREFLDLRVIRTRDRGTKRGDETWEFLFTLQREREREREREGE